VLYCVVYHDRFTTEQARGIQTILRQRGLNASCYFAMRYWKPYTSEVLDAIESDFNGMGVDALVVLPLYPHYSVSTSGSSLRVLKEEIEKYSTAYITFLSIFHLIYPLPPSLSICIFLCLCIYLHIYIF
jgi:protoheme ferro-lyase